MQTFCHHNYIINLKDSITLILSIIGLCIAYSGLKTWKNQLRGTTKYKIAKDILINTFKLRDEIDYARSPLMTSAEMQNASTKKLESVDDLNFRAHRKRLMKLNDAKSKLEVVKLEADAVFGKKETTDIKELIVKVYDINSSFNSFYEIKGIEDITEAEQKIIQEDRYILYGTGSEKDKFNNETKKLIDNIELKFRQYLK
ncbi:MAG: hypothetical protein PHW42_05135 [Patescibacteria group bacterium]|nr:hypothetical protein [Patescibacteria group bacterium]